MEQKLINEYLDSIVKEIDHCEKKDDYKQVLAKYEEKFYQAYEKSVHDNLIPELQKNDTKPEQKQTQYFLGPSNQQEQEYLQGSYRTNKFMQDQKQSEAPQFLQKNLMYGQEQLYNQQYIHPSKNYVDVEANSKMFYNEQNPYLKDLNRPNQDFANVQALYMNQQKLLNLSQPEIKDIYPRQIVNPFQDEIPKPDFLRQNQVADQKLKNNLEKLGGIQDTVKVMEESLKQNEIQAYYEKLKREQFQFNQMVNTQGVDPTGRKPPIAQNPVSTQQQQYGGYDPFNKNPYSRLQYSNIQPQLAPYSGQPVQSQQFIAQQPQQMLISQPHSQSQAQFQSSAPNFYKKPMLNNTYAQDPFKQFEDYGNQKYQDAYRQTYQ